MWTIDVGIFLHHAESTLHLGPIQILKQNFGYTSTQRLVLSLTSEIQIPSTSGDNTKVWVVISRSSNRYVDELGHRES